MPNSSFAEAHKVLPSEPTHMEDEDEDEDQEYEKEDERDCEEYKEENQDAQPQETWMTRCVLHLEPMSCATLL